MSLGKFPLIYCDFCGVEVAIPDLVRMIVVERNSHAQHDLGYDFHHQCGVSARNLLLEYGAMLSHGRIHHLLPGPGAWR